MEWKDKRRIILYKLQFLNRKQTDASKHMHSPAQQNTNVRMGNKLLRPYRCDYHKINAHPWIIVSDTNSTQSVFFFINVIGVNTAIGCSHLSFKCLFSYDCVIHPTDLHTFIWFDWRHITFLWFKFVSIIFRVFNCLD